MKKYIVGLLVVIVLALQESAARAGVASKAVQEAVEYAARKFGKEAASEGIEKLSQKAGQLALKHGDDIVVAAVRKAGPRAAKVAVEAGEHSGTALRLLANHGDDALRLASKPSALRLVAAHGEDAATALIRHGTVGEKLVGEFAENGARALTQVSQQNGRRLAMLASDGVLKPDLVEVVARHGDRACEFVWKNKGALAVGTTLAVFVANPEEFLDGTRDLASVIAESAVRPIAELPKAVATEAARQVNWTLLGLIGGGGTIALIASGKVGKWGKVAAKICGKLLVGQFKSPQKNC